MKKKLIGIILATTLVAIVFAGCFEKDNEDEDEETLIPFTIYVSNMSDYNHSVNISIRNTSSQFYWNFTCLIEKHSTITYERDLHPFEIFYIIEFKEIDERGNYHPAPTMANRKMVSDKNKTMNIRIANGDYLVTS